MYNICVLLKCACVSVLTHIICASISPTSKQALMRYLPQLVIVLLTVSCRYSIVAYLTCRYSIVILDEAHERTVHTDLLFGVVKGAQASRLHQQLRQLRIIIMSATLAAEEFAEYFNGAKILYIQGRQYPVKLYYTVTPQSDYINSAITTVLQLHQEEVQDGKSKGDILVFLTGREEIESVQEILLKCQEMFPSDWLEMVVSPLFAALPSAQQQRVFQPTPKGCRKVVLATNIAETSITIPGVSYVIDTGVVKARGYKSSIGLDLLTVQPISRAQVCMILYCVTNCMYVYTFLMVGKAAYG